MGDRRIFSRGRGQIQGCTFFREKVDDFLVVILKTQVLTVTTNAQNTLTLYHISRGSKCPQNTGKQGINCNC